MARWLLGAVLAAPFFCAHAQAAPIRVLRSLSVEQGLVNPQIGALYEDRAGFLWIGTNDGVSRFDGDVFASFGARQGVPPDWIRALGESADGTLWLGGEGGLRQLSGGIFVPDERAGNWAARPVFAIALAGDGALLVGGEAGLFERRADGTWIGRLSLRETGRGGVRSLLVARDGSLLAGTPERGLLEVRKGKVSPKPAGKEPFAAQALLEGRDGTLYVGTSRGLLVRRESGWEPVPAAGSHFVSALAEGPDGAVYVGTCDAGILALRPPGLARGPSITTANGLFEHCVRAILPVRRGPVYVGTNGGLNVLGTGLVVSWPSAAGGPRGAVAALAEDASGRLFAVRVEEGAFELVGEAWVPVRGDETGGRWARTVTASPSGDLLIGTVRGEVLRLRDGRLRSRIDLAGSGVRMVRRVLEAPGGELYVATDRGVGVLSEAGRRFWSVADGLAHREVRDLAFGRDGELWVATVAGLSRLHRGGVRTWRVQDGLADREVLSVFVDRAGRVLAGTRRGLSVLEGGRFRTLDADGGLPGDVVVCVVDDDAGQAVVSTTRGISLVDLSAPVPAGPRVLPLWSLGHRTGNPGACLRDRSGRLWFGIEGAISVYDPAKAPPRRPPVVVLAYSEAGGEPASAEELAALPSERNDLVLSFTGIDLAAFSLRFRHRLVGADSGWIAGTERSARYANLPPGRYRFEVAAAGDSGLWSEPLALAVNILPPPWWQRTGLVLGLAAGAFVLAGSVLAVYRVRQLLAVERLRTSIAADLHDHIGAGLTEITILADAARRQGGPQRELARMSGVASDLVDRMSDIVWLIHPRRDGLLDLVLRLKDGFADLFAHRGAELEVVGLDGLDGVVLPVAWRRDLYLLLREALHNALRHSGAGHVRLSVARTGRRLEVEVEDDGTGFDPDTAPRGEGLLSMEARARRLGGRLSVETGEQGTKVRLSGHLPRQRAMALGNRTAGSHGRWSGRRGGARRAPWPNRLTECSWLTGKDQARRRTSRTAKTPRTGSLSLVSLLSLTSLLGISGGLWVAFPARVRAAQ